MNSSISLSETYRCQFPETRAVNSNLSTWKADMKAIWISGACFSTLGYLLLIGTALLFPVWRTNRQNQVWLHLCGSYLVFTLIYVSRDFSLCYNKAIVSILIYLGQVMFCWQLTGAWLAYKRLVIIFIRRNDDFMLNAVLFSWLTPVPFSVTRFTLDYIEYADVMFHDSANKVSFKTGGRSVKFKNILDFIYLVKDIAMYFPVFVTIAISTILYIMVVYSLLWKRNEVEGQTRQDRVGNVVIAIMFLVKSGVQFLLVIFNRFYTFTQLDYFTAFLTTYHVFMSTLVFLFAVKSSRDLWFNFIRKNF